MRSLVLAGSLGTTRAMWDPLLPLLAHRYDAVAHDHPGHGDSPPGPRTLEEIGRHWLGLLPERAWFCGVSLGGMAGIWLAANAPERIERLVLCCTAPRFGPPEAWDQRAALAREQEMEPLVETLLDRWFTPAFPERDRFAAMLRAVSPEGYARCCEAVRDADLRPELARISAPTLVVVGSDDPAVSAEDRGLLASIRDVRMIQLPGRHLAPVEQPRAFVEALAA